MPLPTASAQTEWNSYLIENFSGHGDKILYFVEKLLSSRLLPQVSILKEKVNIWSRPNTPCLDVTSQLDGMTRCTIHAIDYGQSLFVGVAFSPPLATYPSYYKQMAASAFMETIDRCVVEAINEVAKSLAKETLKVKVIGKSGKFGE